VKSVLVNVVASNEFKWFYWLGFILAASMALWLLATAVGYYVRVIRPKHRGRQST
jgi:mannose/fructose/N-acetylgalactosamine-specific phosphotransferase system component IIC